MCSSNRSNRQRYKNTCDIDSIRDASLKYFYGTMYRRTKRHTHRVILPHKTLRIYERSKVSKRQTVYIKIQTLFLKQPGSNYSYPSDRPLVISLDGSGTLTLGELARFILSEHPTKHLFKRLRWQCSRVSRSRHSV